MKQAFANTLADTVFIGMSQCERYGMAYGCDIDCPVLQSGKCELRESENKELYAEYLSLINSNVMEEKMSEFQAWLNHEINEAEMHKIDAEIAISDIFKTKTAYNGHDWNNMHDNKEIREHYLGREYLLREVQIKLNELLNGQQ